MPSNHWTEMIILRDGETREKADPSMNTPEAYKSFLQSMAVRRPETEEPEYVDDDLEMIPEGGKREQFYIGSAEAPGDVENSVWVEAFIVTNENPEEETRRTRQRAKQIWREKERLEAKEDESEGEESGETNDGERVESEGKDREDEREEEGVQGYDD